MHGLNFVSIPTGTNGMSLCCSGCMPPAVSRRADCRCDEPSEGVHVTWSTASRRSWPPDVDPGYGLFVLPAWSTRR